MSDKAKTPVKIDLPNAVEDGIGIRLKSAREIKGLSQSDLHRSTGLSRMVISKYESGQNKPGSRELRLLCDALGVSPNYLIYGTEEILSKSDNLADLVFGLRGEGAVIATTLIPVVSSALGKDDVRNILNLTETLLKAKSPKEYALITRLLKAARRNSGKSIAETNWLIDGELLIESVRKSIQAIFDQNGKT